MRDLAAPYNAISGTRRGGHRRTTRLAVWLGESWTSHDAAWSRTSLAKTEVRFSGLRPLRLRGAGRRALRHPARDRAANRLRRGNVRRLDGYDTDVTFRCHRAGLRLAVALDIPLIHFSNGNVGTAWLEYDRRFCAKHAGKLAGGEGIWLNVRRRVRTRTEVCAAYELSPLVALTSEVARSAAVQEYAGAR
jgi:hypothetical protein